jgi:predicted FMN-binding regulatory protein PaiB
LTWPYVAVDVKGWVKVIVEDKDSSSYPSRVAARPRTLNLFDRQIFSRT